MQSSSSSGPTGPRLIQSVERATAILEIIARQGGAASLKQIAALAGIGKTTAHNLLQTLDHLGYVRRRSGDTRYYLGSSILNLARIAGNDSATRAKLRPTMEAIARRTGHTAWLAVPAGDEVAYLDIVDFRHPEATSAPAPFREKLEGSAVGLIFLAFIPGMAKRLAATAADMPDHATRERIEETRAKGYALDLENYHPGINGVAIPWRENGDVHASLCVTGPAAELPRGKLIRLAWMMMEMPTPSVQ
ncbi:IclR family transcriptional regulator [Acetobacter sp.]|uniref:IclR family transcriptional regulator n=1 Tax=Acetobacter sp. TaxID=440 RepID=UPI0039E90AB0